jgi:hypothetical protein
MLLAALRNIYRGLLRRRDRWVARSIYYEKGKALDLVPGDVPLFAVVRDERHQIVTFLQHYRSHGVSRFFIIDNGSTDGTDEYLLSQPDVELLRTDLPLGRVWSAMNAVIERFALGMWCLVSDADERFVYPGCERAGLSQLTAFLDMRSETALNCSWVDMYADCPLSRAVVSESAPMTAQFPFLTGMN